MISLVIKSWAHRLLDVVFAAKVVILRMIGVIDFPVPPSHNIRTTSSKTIRHYYESGIKTMLPISISAIYEGIDLDGCPKILDFGCGAGRQILQWSRMYPNIDIYGCDVDDDVIRYINKQFPKIDAYANSFDPPLKYSDGFFDVVYSVSIFSHLSPNDRDLWLQELSRVLKPEGIALLTFNGQYSLRKAHKKGVRLQFTEEQFARNGVIFDNNDTTAQIEKRTTSPVIGQKARNISREYGETYYHENIVPDVFGRNGLKFQRLLKGVVDRLQDLVVLKKKM